MTEGLEFNKLWLYFELCEANTVYCSYTDIVLLTEITFVLDNLKLSVIVFSKKKKYSVENEHTNHTDLTFSHPSWVCFINHCKSEGADSCTVCLDMQNLLQHSSFLQYRWPSIFPFCAPFLPHLTAWGQLGALRYVGAHSFMSDTELSHCEQFLFGSMLTNELSSASSEKSFHSSVRSRKSELHARLALQEKKNLHTTCKIIQILNGDCGLKWCCNQSCKSNNVCCSHAVTYPNERSRSTAVK